MPRDMFGDVVDPSIKIGSKKWYTVPLSILVHGRSSAHHHHSADGSRRAAHAAVDDGVRGGAAAATATTAAAAATDGRGRAQPVSGEPERGPGRGADRDQAGDRHRHRLREGVRRCRRRRPGWRRRRRRRRAARSATATAAPAAPVRVGGNIKPPQKVRDVRPTYPAIAQSARVQGIVIIEATIGPTARCTDAKVLRSIPLLDQAALDAVRQWEFTPTLLNGVPVPVIMTVTVQVHACSNRAVAVPSVPRSPGGRRTCAGVESSVRPFVHPEGATKWKAAESRRYVESDGLVAKAVAVVLFFMSFWSVGVAIERIFTFTQATQAVEALRTAGGQAPQGRPAEGRDRAVAVEELPLQPPREGGARRAAGVPVPAGGGRGLSRDDLVDTVRRSIQRATALTPPT